MAVALGSRARADGFTLAVLDSVGSTNAEALTRHGQDRLWIVAGQQTAGRGRRGRAWMSPSGNLYASVLLQSPGSRDRVPELSFVAALAIHDAVAPEIAARIKWPNDLLLDGRKFTGLLVEGGRDGAVVVGIGVNCRHHPEGTEFPATDLGGVLTPETLFPRLSDAFAVRLTQWRGGFAAIREAWLVRASGLGEPIRVRLPDRTLTGRFETIDERGRLMLRDDHGRIEPITAGDVFPLDEALAS